MTPGDSDDRFPLLRRIRDELRATRAELSSLHLEGVPGLAAEPDPAPDRMQAVLAILAETRRELSLLDD